MFGRYRTHRQLLPAGIFPLNLTSLNNDSNNIIILSSTSKWYRLKSNPKTFYTTGIVFNEVTSVSLPMSLNGVEIVIQSGKYTIENGAISRAANEIDELVTGYINTTNALDFTKRDIFELVSGQSFLKTYVDSLLSILPSWVSLTLNGNSAIEVHDLKTELVYGHSMEQHKNCHGAPVFEQHIYNVFIFGSQFSLSVYNNKIDLPKPLNGYKFCLIVDIYQSQGSSIFLIVPDESKHILNQFEVFQKLIKYQNISVLPRGIGISTSKGVSVHHHTKELEFWNGDAMFKYRYDIFK